MAFYVTLVSEHLSQKTISLVIDRLGFEGCPLTGEMSWLAVNRAADIPIACPPRPKAMAQLRAQLAAGQIDIFLTTAENRCKKLLLADMDSTIVKGETLDDLAGCLGTEMQEKIAGITARAMNGELDFEDALRERVALLQDMPEEMLHRTREKGSLNKGAEPLVRHMKAAGALCVLVSGGFTYFTGFFAAKAGFQRHHGNTLEIENGRLTGRVAEPILNRDSKRKLLNDYCRQLGITPDQALTIGDGANDLPMLKAAGLGIGYYPKPAVRSQIGNCLFYGDLTAVLFAQGFRESATEGFTPPPAAQEQAR